MKYTLIAGATGGLGSEIARLLSAQGRALLLTGRNLHKLQQLADQLPGKVLIHAADLTVSQQVDQLKQFALGEWGVPDQLINCAGRGLFGELETLDPVQISAALTDNLLPIILPCQAFVVDMKLAGGTIINVMSTAALKGKAAESIYCAAKWGVRGFTESLREEVKGTAVRVVAIYPAGMASDFWKGTDYPVEKFMSAKQAAEMIIPALSQVEKGYISDIHLSR